MTAEEKAEEREQLRVAFSALAMMALIMRGSTRNDDLAIVAVNHAEALLGYLDRTAPQQHVG